MSLCGRIEWCGPDPTVVRLTDNGVRKVQIALHDAWGIHRLDIAAEVADPDQLISDLVEALAWVEEEN